VLPEEIEHVESDLQIAAFRAVQELLGDGSALESFAVRLLQKGNGYCLETCATGSTACSSAAPPTGNHSLAALRVGILALGGQWAGHHDGAVTTTVVMLPRQT
jgi:hypothetical protein